MNYMETAVVALTTLSFPLYYRLVLIEQRSHLRAVISAAVCTPITFLVIVALFDILEKANNSN